MLSNLSKKLNNTAIYFTKYVWPPVRNFADEASVPVKPPMALHIFEDGKIAKEIKIKKTEGLELYEHMVLTRRMETEISNLYKAGKVAGFCHLYVGTEAIGAGIVSNMIPADNLITSYRCHAYTMIFSNKQGKDGGYITIAELAGRGDGISEGKGGSMHMFVPPVFFGGQGIVGGQVPLGAGLGFANKYTGNGGVNFTLYGDGASNQGQVFEAFNMSVLYKLPIVYVCENNQYGMGTAAKRSSCSTEYYKAGRVIPGIMADGMDCITTKETIRAAVEFVRGGNGPLIVQFETYRYFGHSMSDPGTSYRSRKEVEEVRKTRDPIAHMKALLLDAKLATEDELKAIDKKGKDFCANARKKAEKAAIPDPKNLYTQVYVKYLENTRRRTILSDL